MFVVSFVGLFVVCCLCYVCFVCLVFVVCELSLLVVRCASFVAWGGMFVGVCLLLFWVVVFSWRCLLFIVRVCLLHFSFWVVFAHSVLLVRVCRCVLFGVVCCCGYGSLLRVGVALVCQW